MVYIHINNTTLIYNYTIYSRMILNVWGNQHLIVYVGKSIMLYKKVSYENIYKSTLDKLMVINNNAFKM